MTPPTLIYATGVGLSPNAFGSVADQVGGSHRLWVRPGYEGRPAPNGLADQVDDLARLVDEVGPAWVVGLSGGATLALALGLAPPPGLVGIVTHEPLVGPLVPELDARVRAGAVSVQQGGVDAIDAFLLGLYGADSWARLPVEFEEWRRRHRDVAAAEISAFAGFAPDRSDLETMTISHCTTVGARSGPERQQVAALLADTGAEAVTIPDCGHLALVDAPEALAATIIDCIGVDE